MFCDSDAPNGAVREWAVIDGVTWWHRLRAVKRLVNGGGADGRCMLVSRLSAVLEGITNNDVSGGSVPFAMAAAMTPPRPDSKHRPHDQGCEVAQRFLGAALSPVLLNHVRHEAVVRGSSESCLIWTTLSTTKVSLLLLSHPRLSRPSIVGHRRWCWGCALKLQVR